MRASVAIALTAMTISVLSSCTGDVYPSVTRQVVDLQSRDVPVVATGSFAIANDGDRSVEIGEIRSSCSCFHLSLSAGLPCVIDAKCKTEAQFTLDSPNSLGRFSYTATLFDSRGNVRHVVTVCGLALGEPRVFPKSVDLSGGDVSTVTIYTAEERGRLKVSDAPSWVQAAVVDGRPGQAILRCSAKSSVREGESGEVVLVTATGRAIAVPIRSRPPAPRSEALLLVSKRPSAGVAQLALPEKVEIVGRMPQGMQAVEGGIEIGEAAIPGIYRLPCQQYPRLEGMPEAVVVVVVEQ